MSTKDTELKQMYFVRLVTEHLPVSLIIQSACSALIGDISLY